MCDPVTLAIIATTVSAGSAVMSGQQQKETANYQARQADADAEAEKGAAAVRAQKIREITRQRAASATAATAASGLDVDSTSANLINADIIKRGEMDALTGIDDSMDQASRLRAQAQGLRIGGKQAQMAGYAQAVGSAISTTSQVKSGWYGNNQPINYAGGAR